MKGFIEVTQIDDENKKSQKILINVGNIVRVSSAENTYYKSLIDVVTNMGYYAVETYEEIKQKIKEATEPRPMIDEKGNLKEQK